MAAPPASRLDQTQILQKSFDEANGRLRVDASVTATIGTLAVEIDAADGDNIAISDGVNQLQIETDGSINVNTALDHTSDSVKIGDGTDFLSINSDGSIDVNAVIAGTIKNKYSEVTAVASAVDTLILTHTVAISGAILKIAVSGDNIATYVVKINGVTQDKVRTYFSGALNSEFNFDVGGGEGLTVLAGDVIQVRVTHNRPDVGDFNARLQYKEN